jgi:hypothetical protein
MNHLKRSVVVNKQPVTLIGNLVTADTVIYHTVGSHGTKQNPNRSNKSNTLYSCLQKGTYMYVYSVKTEIF